MNRRKLDNLIRCERGQSMTELALVLPALCLVLMVIVQFGIVFHDYITLTDAVRAGSREATVSRLDPNRETATRDAVRAAAPRLELPDAAISVSSSWEPGEPVTVVAVHPYDVNVPFLDLPVFSGNLESKITERVE